jgi:two-component system LytT family response regulator
MTTTCLIIDDEKLARDLVREYLESFPDVQMPGMTGFDVLDEIIHEPAVIFTTAYDQYAIKAFEKNAIDYLLKPIDQERFQTALNRAIKRKTSEDSNLEDLLSSLRKVNTRTSYDSHIFVQKSEKLFNLSVEEILYLEASGDYTIITTKNDQFVSSSGIGKLEEIMDPDTFIRVHRSTIINLNYLKEIERHFNGGMVVKMNTGKSFPVSRTYAKVIRKKVV